MGKQLWDGFAAVQGSCPPPLPPGSPHTARPVRLHRGRLQGQALKFSCWFAPSKNHNGDFNIVIHQEVFKGFVKDADMIMSAFLLEKLSPTAVQCLSCGHTAR